MKRLNLEKAHVTVVWTRVRIPPAPPSPRRSHVPRLAQDAAAAGSARATVARSKIRFFGEATVDLVHHQTMEFSHWVYLLTCADGHTYVGCTKDLSERLRQHQAGLVRFTRDKLPVQCVATFGFADRQKAFAFEKYLKTGSGRAFMNRHLR